MHITKLFYKFLKLDFNYFLYAGSWTLIKQFLISTSLLLITYFFTNFSSKQDFGLFNLFLAIFSSLAIFSMPGIFTALLDSISRGYELDYVKYTFKRIRWSILGSILLIITGSYYYYTESETLGLSLIASSLAFPFYHSLLNYSAFLIAKKDFKKEAIFNSASSLVSMLTVVTAIMLKLNIFYIIILYLLSNLTINVFCYLRSLKNINKKVSDSKEFNEFSDLISFNSILGLLASNLDKILLGLLAGYQTLAIYVVANIIPDGLNKNIKLFMSIFIIKLTGKSQRQIKYILSIYLFRMLFIGAVFALISFFVLPLVINLLFTSAYNEAVFYSQLLAITIFLTPLIIGLNGGITFLKDKKSLLLINTIPQLLKLGLYLLLIPLFDIYGIIVAIIVERVAIAILLVLLLFKE